MWYSDQASYVICFCIVYPDLIERGWIQSPYKVQLWDALAWWGQIWIHKETGLEDRPDRRSLKGHRRFKTVWFRGRPGCDKEGKWEISGLEAEYVWDVRAWEAQACRCGRWSGAPIRPPKQTERFKAMGVWEIFCSLGNLPSVSSQKSLRIYRPDWKTGRRRVQANNFSTTLRLLPMWRMLENVKRDLAELHFRHPKKKANDSEEDLLYQVVCENGKRDRHAFSNILQF